MKKIFTSYRRTDTEKPASDLAEIVGTRVGRDNVFIDIHTIRPGEPFADVIDEWLDQCDLLLALIGAHWLKEDSAGRRRIDSEDDFVRHEIRRAFELGITVVPVLIGTSAEMPSRQQLPSDIDVLPNLNAGHHLRVRTFQQDAELMLDSLDIRLPIALEHRPWKLPRSWSRRTRRQRTRSRKT